MKREIVCKPCGQKLRGILLPSDPGDGVTFVAGKLKTGCFCDGCNKALVVGDEAEALSIYGDPYEPWELVYLDI